MSKQRIIWYKGHVSDLREQIKLITDYQIDSFVANLCDVKFKREFEKQPLAKAHQIITRPDMILSPSEW